jgi:hypothetical protein
MTGARPRRKRLGLPSSRISALALSGEYVRARQAMVSLYAARAAAIVACVRPCERAAAIAALRAEEASALRNFSREWHARRRANRRSFTKASVEIARRRLQARRPRRVRPHRRPNFDR